jgi:hypothetical protein
MTPTVITAKIDAAAAISSRLELTNCGFRAAGREAGSGALAAASARSANPRGGAGAFPQARIAR